MGGDELYEIFDVLQQFEGYVWRESKLRKVEREHSVTFLEVIESLRDPRARWYIDDRYDDERSICVGQTRGGRILKVVLIYPDVYLFENNLAYLITAYDADGNWLSEYQSFTAE